MKIFYSERAKRARKHFWYLGLSDKKSKQKKKQKKKTTNIIFYCEQMRKFICLKPIA